MRGWRYYLVLGVFLFVCVAVSIAVRPLSFDSDGWKANPNSRPRMVRDLLDRGLLQGKTRYEIQSLLGKPNEPQGGGKEYEYWAGMNMIDDMWLTITFENDRVTQTDYLSD
jgi:hypothetical protein